MSGTATLHPDEKYKAGKAGQRLFQLGLIGFLVLIAISLFFASRAESHYTRDVLDGASKLAPDQAAKLTASGMSRFFYAYIIGWAWTLSIALGSMLFVLIHHAVKAKWSVTTRRLAEILTMTLPVIFLAGLVFVIPLLAGNKDIYFWAHPDAHFPAKKASWLSPAFFAARYVVFFVIWIGIARYFESRSRRMDVDGDV